MKKLILMLILTIATVSTTSVATANWFGNNNNGEWKMGPNGPYWDESDWPEWTPMYWMEEFMDSWDDNNNNYGGGYGVPYSGYGMTPYGGGNYNQAPYGYIPPTGNYQYQYPTIPAMPTIPTN